MMSKMIEDWIGVMGRKCLWIYEILMEIEDGIW